MGYWYWRPLKTLWDLDHAVTQRFDLPERGYLSGLMVKLSTINELNLFDYIDPYPHQRITFRIVGNGNVELVDLRGRQLQAMNFWDKGVMPWDNLTIHDGSGVDQYSFIPFGRYLGDPRYGLILDRFASGVQFEESNTFSDTYYVDGSSKLTMYGLFRKDPEADIFNGGFLKKRQVLNKDTASETQYSVKLPTVNKLRQINMFTEPDMGTDDYLPDTGPFTNLNKIWLGIKSKEEYILDNMDVSQYARFMHQFYNRKPETKINCRSGAIAEVIDTMIYEREDSLAVSNYGQTDYNIALDNLTMWERCEKVWGFNQAGGAINANVYLRNQGICYHGHVPILMQDPMSGEEDWLDAMENKDVYVEFTEAASTGNIYVVLDELQKTYPS